MSLDLYGDPIPEEEIDGLELEDVSFFEFFVDLTYKQKNIMKNNDIWNIEELYVPYNMNKALSQSDVLPYVNNMNGLPHLPNRLQYDYFINSIRPKKRRVRKWLKSLKVNVAIKEYYNYSNQKAKDALLILDESEIEYIKSKTYKGGKENDKC